jgi:hypothetical protein
MSLPKLELVRRLWDLCSCTSPMLHMPSPLQGRVCLVHNGSRDTLLSTLPFPAVFLQCKRKQFRDAVNTCGIFLYLQVNIALDGSYEGKPYIQCDSNQEHVEDKLHVSGRDVWEIWISRPARHFLVLFILGSRRVIRSRKRKHISLLRLRAIIAVRVVLRDARYVGSPGFLYPLSSNRVVEFPGSAYLLVRSLLWSTWWYVRRVVWERRFTSR